VEGSIPLILVQPRLGSSEPERTINAKLNARVTLHQEETPCNLYSTTSHTIMALELAPAAFIHIHIPLLAVPPAAFILVSRTFLVAHFPLVIHARRLSHMARSAPGILPVVETVLVNLRLSHSGPVCL